MGNAEHMVDKFRFSGEENFIFACQASVPLVLTAELLYQLWNNFKQYEYEFDPGRYYKISHIAVSDLLLSPLCEPVGFEIYRFKTDVREILAEDLINYLGKKRKNTIARFLHEYAGIESNFQQRKKLRTIHALTAQFILDPAAMERQIVHQINEAKTDSEKIDLLLLHKNIVPFGFNSDLSNITNNLVGNRLNPILAIEEDEHAQGILTVNLPLSLKEKIRKKTPKEKEQESGKTSPAEQLIEDCIKDVRTTLDLGFCGLTDADFIKGGAIDKSLRRCIHLRWLILGNLPITVGGQTIREANSGNPNHLNAIPESVGQLINLETFVCCGTLEDRWGIQDLSVLFPLKHLRVLDVKFNHIEQIPVLSSAIALRDFSLAHNDIKELTGISHFANLKSLDLTGNKIASLKQLVPLLKRKSEPMEVNLDFESRGENNNIWIGDNPIEEPPFYFVERGRIGILDYYAESTAPDITQLQSLIGQLESDDVHQIRANAIVVLGSELNPMLGNELYLLTVALSAEDMNAYPSRLSVVLPGYNSAFRISHAAWSSSWAKLNFSLWEFLPIDREKLETVIRESKISHFTFAKFISKGDERANLVAYVGKEIVSLPVKTNRQLPAHIAYSIGSDWEPSSKGCALLNDRGELVGMDVGTVPGSAILMRTIQDDVEAMVSSLRYRNGDILRICVLYSDDVKQDVYALKSYIDRRVRKYWIEQRRTRIELTLISGIEIADENDFSTALTQADMLLAFPGDPDKAGIHYYLQDLLMEMFAGTEEDPGPTTFLISKDKLRRDFQDWVIKVHAGILGYLKVDDIIERLNSHLEMIALAKKYQWIRETMPASGERTGVMTETTNNMKHRGEGIITSLNPYMNSLSPGKRLAAIAALEGYPNSKCLLWLAGRVGDDETPFIGFRASVSLAAAFGQVNTDRNLMRDAVEIAWASLKLSSFQDPNQVRVIKNLRDEMMARQEIRPTSTFSGSWTGYYRQQTERINFSVEIIVREDNKLIGVVCDDGPLGKADIHGEIFPKRHVISFSKKYRRRDKNDYWVEYLGEWKSSSFIIGSWTIPGTDSTGTFEMTKYQDRAVS